MNSPQHIIAFSLLLIITLLGCSKTEQEPSIIFNLEEEFVIRPSELLSRTGSKLMLEISSLQEDHCDNSEILYHYRQVNGVAIIKLNDITKPENCNTTAIAPSAQIALNPNGSNSRMLNVTIKEVIENEGQIDEYANRFEIKMNTTNGIRLSHNELIKIQPATLWGGVDFNSADSTDVADQFIADIAQMAQARPLFQGYYGQFEKTSAGKIILWNNDQASNHRTAFAFESNMALSEMESTIADYRSRYPSLEFFIYNGLGESL